MGFLSKLKSYICSTDRGLIQRNSNICPRNQENKSFRQLFVVYGYLLYNLLGDILKYFNDFIAIESRCNLFLQFVQHFIECERTPCVLKRVFS